MAFGNPYGDLWNVEEVIEAISLMEVDNLRMISLADTVGMATPEQISELVGAVMAKYDYLEIGVHLHSRPEQAAAKDFGGVRCRAAGALIRQSAGWVAVRSRRMRWSATSRPRK